MPHQKDFHSPSFYDNNVPNSIRGVLFDICNEMEDDRLETNLGIRPEPDFAAEIPDVVKTPKRRFVGRKHATVKGDEQNASANGSIEDSGAIQGDER